MQRALPMIILGCEGIDTGAPELYPLKSNNIPKLRSAALVAPSTAFLLLPPAYGWLPTRGRLWIDSTGVGSPSGALVRPTYQLVAWQAPTATPATANTPGCAQGTPDPSDTITHIAGQTTDVHVAGTWTTRLITEIDVRASSPFDTAAHQSLDVFVYSQWALAITLPVDSGASVQMIWHGIRCD